MSSHNNEHKKSSDLQQSGQISQEEPLQDFPSFSETASLHRHIETLNSKNITSRNVLGLQRMVGNKATSQLLSRMRLEAGSGNIQRWAATAISNETMPKHNSELKEFITDNELEKEGGKTDKNLEDMTDFNTLHHIISRDIIGQTLAPALKNGLNSQTQAVRTAANAFFNKVKEAVTFHADIMDQPVLQEQRLRTLLQNMPLNFELGYREPTGDPGIGFDPQVTKGQTVNGITTYVMTTLSAALKELHTELKTLSKNPTADKWNELTAILTRAVNAYEGLDDKMGLLMRPDMDQWDVFNGEKQKKRDGQYIDDVQAAFQHAGNSYATSDNLEDTSRIEKDWRVVLPYRKSLPYGEVDPNIPTMTFETMTFQIDLRHIAERHTMKFFQFDTTATNPFLPGINTVASLKQYLTNILTTIFKPCIETHMDEIDLEGNDWPGFDRNEPLGGYFTLFNMGTEKTNQANRETIFVKVTTISPDEEIPTIRVTQPKIQKWLTENQKAKAKA